MGSNISLIIPFYGQARRLGNPDRPLYFVDSPITGIYHGLSILEWSLTANSIDDTYAGTTVFGYQTDFRRFDTGRIVIIKYERNHYEPGLENQILNSKRRMPLAEFHKNFFPDILDFQPSHYLMVIKFRTINGIKTFEPIHSRSRSIDDMPYNNIPETLNFPRVPISELLITQDLRSCHPGIIVVSYKEKLYIFKFHGLYTGPCDKSITWDDRILEELLLLSKHRSPFILPPSYIVTGVGKSVSKFRGYLQPYFPAGSLHDVFLRLHSKTKIVPKQNLLTWNYSLGSFNKCMAGTPSTVPGHIEIVWPVKQKWAIEITSCISVLHKDQAYIGHMALDNFLLDQNGCIKMIDISPLIGFDIVSSPPEVDGGMNVELTGPRDIFNLGLVLWCLAEEMTEFERETLWHVPKPT